MPLVQKFRSSEVQKFRSMPPARYANRSGKVQEESSNPMNYSVTPATPVTSVFFFGIIL
jgi:hypothetical protein